jgi:tRNA(Ile)-lysidine synthase
VTDEVRRFVQTRGVNGPGVVAVSGGADSVALLRALIAAGAGPLTAAHVNHGLRAAESDADEAFVRGLAERLGVTWCVARLDVAKMAADAGANLEATARRLRYDWLAEVAADVRAKWVATGHTADDQAETVLHRLVRGTGLQGLRGIAAVKAGPGREPWAAAVIRPLLTVTRAEVLGYLASLNQPYRTDSSNADPRFTRNRIRAELLPLLRTFNPEIVSVLDRLADQASEAFAVLEADAAALLAEAELPRAGDRLVLDAPKLTAAHPYRVREALRLLWRREGWPTERMTFDHWNRLVAVARGEPPAADFPGGVTARHAGRVVQLGRGV